MAGRVVRIAAWLASAAIVFSAGWQAATLYQCSARGKNKLRMVKAKGFKYTNPLLDVELPEGFNIQNELHPFKHKVVALVETCRRKGLVQDIAVYYRDLQDGPWFGINQDAAFLPASLMKVPVMIAWLKRAEKDPKELQRAFLYTGSGSSVPEQVMQPKQSIITGQRYRVEELLRYMMEYSDNRAAQLLYANLGVKELNDVLDSMDVDNQLTDTENVITVHGYSGFFRILYNASYLSRAMSEKALQLLSQPDFPQGMAAGLPPGIPLASKYGERAQLTPAGTAKQLHEFGIVYHPRSHYILGIMTKGKDFDKQADVIREISRLVYTEVDRGAVEARR